MLYIRSIKTIQFNLPVSIFKEGSTFIAYTPALDLATYADSFADAKKNFEELIPIFFMELENKGTTEEFLISLGWHKLNKSWDPPIEVEHTTQSFQVPVKA